MSIYLDIKETLFDDRKIVVVDIFEPYWDPVEEGGCQEVNIYIAPKSGTRSAEDLQELLDGLLPLPPSDARRFCERENRLEFGCMYFDEHIGTMSSRREFTLTDETLCAKLPESFISPTKVIEEKCALVRRIWIRLYPNVQIALWASQGQFRDDIPKKVLEAQNRLPRLLHRLGFKVR
ncbi:MAG: hypothetical protein ABSE18_02070 [Minisyncoccia bacterium]|jgi:hypothetical protein